MTDDELRARESIRDLVARYNANGDTGRFDQVVELFAPDAVHSARGNNPIAGDYKGVDDILGFYGKLFELSDGTFRAELESTKADGDDKIVATHRHKAERGGKRLDMDQTLTFTISDGKFTYLLDEASDQAAYDAFWS